MQFIPLIFSGFWVASSSVLLGDIPIMPIPNPYILPAPMSSVPPLASIPARDIPRYQSPVPILSATGRVTLDQRKYDKEIYRYGKKYEPVTYAWERWKDIDFILMIQEESLWNELISGDDGASIGYCQLNRYYSPVAYNEYIILTDWQSRIDLCHAYYEKYRDNIGESFHGWNTRERNLASFSFR